MALQFTAYCLKIHYIAFVYLVHFILIYFIVIADTIYSQKLFYFIYFLLIFPALQIFKLKLYMPVISKIFNVSCNLGSRRRSVICRLSYMQDRYYRRLKRIQFKFFNTMLSVFFANRPTGSKVGRTGFIHDALLLYFALYTKQ